jgi:magnesium-transporting ATPase (P-type)
MPSEINSDLGESIKSAHVFLMMTVWCCYSNSNMCACRHSDLDTDNNVTSPAEPPQTRGSSVSFTRLSYVAGGRGGTAMTADGDTAVTESSDDHNDYLHHDPHRDSRATGTYTRHSLSTELALVIDGVTLEDIWSDAKSMEMFRSLVRDMSTVIACRVSPLQKASLVRMIKTGQGKPVTLAIGDGANDIGMINEAKVGVGICGNEGRHAANSADFAIGQFRFLAPLMLKHGRYNYIRCSKLVLYCFFKNLVLVSSLFYFCIYSGFSGTMPLDSIIFSGFNFYLGLPILCVGIFDIDVPYEVVVKYPFLAYATGRRREMLNMKTMLRWCLLAFAEGLVLFALVIRVIGGSTRPRSAESDGHSLQGVGLNDLDGKAGGIYAEGFLLYCCVILSMVYKVSSMTYIWNAFHMWSHFLSLCGFFFFVYVYSKIEEIPDFYEVTEFTLGLPNYWLAMLMVPVCICIMDNFVEWLFAQCFPTSRNKLECIAQDGESRKRLHSCDSSESAFAEDDLSTLRKSGKSIKLAPTSSDNENDFAY